MTFARTWPKVGRWHFKLSDKPDFSVIFTKSCETKKSVVHTSKKRQKILEIIMGEIFSHVFFIFHEEMVLYIVIIRKQKAAFLQTIIQNSLKTIFYYILAKLLNFSFQLYKHVVIILNW